MRYQICIPVVSFLLILGLPEFGFSQQTIITANYGPSYTSLLLREGNPNEAVDGSLGYSVGLGLKYPLKDEQILLSLVLVYSSEKYLHSFTGLKFETDILAGTESKLEIPISVNRIGIPSIGFEAYHKKLMLNSNLALTRIVQIKEDNLLMYGTGETEELKEVVYSYPKFNLFMDIGVGFKGELNKNMNFNILIKAGCNFFSEKLYLYHSKANHYRIGGSVGLSFGKFHQK